MSPGMSPVRLVCLSVLGLMALVRSSSQESLCKVTSCGNAEALGGMVFIKAIPEDTSVGDPLAHLEIEGADSDITLTVTQPDDHFSFDPQSRNITVVKELLIRTDRDQRRHMTINCSMVHQKVTIAIKVTLLIADVNNNAPVFDQSSYSASVSEFSPVGTTVISSLRATDTDPDNSYIDYKLVPGNYSSYFDIPIPARGEIVLKKVLDYETIPLLKVAVMAVDNHQDPEANIHFSSTVSVTIRVIDEDDQNPRFRETLYEATVGERAPAGTTLALSPAISAYDPDTFNASLRYSIMVDSLSDTTKVFDIDPVTAVMTLKEASTLRGGQLLSVLVKVTQADNDDRYSSALVPVTVQAVNDHAPQFINNRQTREPRFHIASPRKGDATKFSVDPKTGLIKTTEKLDYETTTQHNLTVEVTDGVYTDVAVVTVDVLDTNDNNPVFSQQEYVFTAYPPTKGKLLGKVQVSDKDAGTIFTFRLLGNHTLFSINDAGEVKLTGDPASMTKGNYELFVIVQDNGQPPRQDSAVIVVVSAVSSQAAPVVEQEIDMVAIILLSVFCGCLALIIAILAVYIYKNGKQQTPPANFVKSKSFEGDLNLPGDGYKSYYDDEAEGVAYSPKSRHLAMYNDMPADAEDSTAPQENPFAGGDNPGYRSSITPRFMQGGVRGSCTYTTRSSNSSGGPHCSQLSDASMVRRMAEVHQMDYEASVAPTDEMEDVLRRQTANDSEPSLAGSTDREIGSTQRLVSSPRARPTSQPSSRDSVATKCSSRSSTSARKDCCTSFVDPHRATSQKQKQSVNAAMSARPPASGRPGITVYY
ncbi:Protein dachsous [Lamellibrachia satsuma]|nr:Protein dachsous [Lamellibrachia satsuma]